METRFAVKAADGHRRRHSGAKRPALTLETRQ